MPKVKRFNRHTFLFVSTITTGILYLILVLYTPLPSIKKPYYVYSTQKGYDLKHLLKKAINQSQHSIQLKSYAISDQGILSLLKQKAREGVKVHLTYDKKTTPNLHKTASKNFFLHPIDQKKGLVHEKIWIFDQQIVFLGSTNLTTSSLTMHDNLMVGLYSPELANHLSFNKRPPSLTISVGNHILQYFSLPNQKALESLINTLKAAQHHIDISLFTFTHPSIAQTLINKHNEGVTIRLTLDRTSSNGASKAIKEHLEEANIPVKISKGLQIFHHKSAYIDSKIFIIGSANWTQSAFNKNSDFLLIIK